MHDVIPAHRRIAGLFDDDGFHGFAAIRIAGSDDAAFLHGRVLVHHRFDFGRPDFVAAGIDHALQAVSKEKETFRIHGAEIA